MASSNSKSTPPNIVLQRSTPRTSDSTPTSSPPKITIHRSSPSAPPPDDTKFRYIAIHFGRFETKGAILKYDGEEAHHEHIECPAVDSQGRRRFEFIPTRHGSVRVHAADECCRFIRTMLNPVVWKECIDGLTLSFSFIPAHFKTIRCLKTKLEEVLAPAFRNKIAKIYIIEEHLMWSNLIEMEKNNEDERIRIEGDVAILKCSPDYSFLYHSKQLCRNVPYGDEDSEPRDETEKEHMENLCLFMARRAGNLKKQMTLLLIGSAFRVVSDFMTPFLEQNPNLAKVVQFRRYLTVGMDDPEVAAALYGAVQDKKVSEYNWKSTYLPK